VCCGSLALHNWANSNNLWLALKFTIPGMFYCTKSLTCHSWVSFHVQKFPSLHTLPVFPKDVQKKLSARDKDAFAPGTKIKINHCISGFFVLLEGLMTS
jgi:hypothetical protein